MLKRADRDRARNGRMACRDSIYRPTPRGTDEVARRGILRVAIGKLFEKGLRVGTGQTNVSRYGT